MNSYIEMLVNTIIPALFIAILTSIITVRLSLKQFYTQKWWEKKVDTYSMIIEELSYLQIYFGELFDEGAQLRQIIDEDRDELRKKYKSSKQLIFKSYASGAYFISKRSIEALEELIKELNKENINRDYMEDYDRWYGATKYCINKIREEAQKDLRR